MDADKTEDKTYEVTAVGTCEETYTVTARSESEAESKAGRGCIDEVVTTDPIEHMEITGVREIDCE